MSRIEIRLSEGGFDARTIGAQPGIALDLLLEFSQRWNFK
jgi:hypothetical protein